MKQKCAWHLCQNALSGKWTVYCSKKCSSKAAVQRRRNKLKQLSVEYMGGKCKKCGYSKSVYALEFHHLDKSKKDFGISASGNTRSWEKLKKELNKCIMLCSNCHREQHEQKSFKFYY